MVPLALINQRKFPYLGRVLRKSGNKWTIIFEAQFLDEKPKEDTDKKVGIIKLLDYNS